MPNRQTETNTLQMPKSLFEPCHRQQCVPLPPNLHHRMTCSHANGIEKKQMLDAGFGPYGWWFRSIGMVVSEHRDGGFGA